MSLLGKVFKLLDKITGSRVTRLIINLKIGEYGKIKTLKIDRKKKKIWVTVKLRGEKSTFTVEIIKYRLIKEGFSGRIEILKAKSNKKWVNAVIKNHIIKKPKSIPLSKFEIIKEFLEE